MADRDKVRHHMASCQVIDPNYKEERKVWKKMESFKRRMRPVLAHFYFLAACVALAACAALVLCVIVSILPCFLFILLKIIMYAMEGSGMQRILHIVCLLCHAIPFMLLSKLMIDYLDTHKYLKSGSSHNDIEMIEGKGEIGRASCRERVSSPV